MHIQVARYGPCTTSPRFRSCCSGCSTRSGCRVLLARERHDALETARRQPRCLYGLLIPAVLALSFSAPLVLSLWLQPKFHPAGLVLVVVTISVGGFPMAGFFAANRVLLISGKTAPSRCASSRARSSTSPSTSSSCRSGASRARRCRPDRLHLAARRGGALRTTDPPPAAPAAAAGDQLCGCRGGRRRGHAVPSHGLFAVARIVATLVSLAVFGAVLQQLISPTGRRSWCAPSAGPTHAADHRCKALI